MNSSINKVFAPSLVANQTSHNQIIFFHKDVLQYDIHKISGEVTSRSNHSTTLAAKIGDIIIPISNPDLQIGTHVDITFQKEQFSPFIQFTLAFINNQGAPESWTFKSHLNAIKELKNNIMEAVVWQTNTNNKDVKKSQEITDTVNKSEHLNFLKLSLSRIESNIPKTMEENLIQLLIGRQDVPKIGLTLGEILGQQYIVVKMLLDEDIKKKLKDRNFLIEKSKIYLSAEVILDKKYNVLILRTLLGDFSGVNQDQLIEENGIIYLEILGAVDKRSEQGKPPSGPPSYDSWKQIIATMPVSAIRDFPELQNDGHKESIERLIDSTVNYFEKFVQLQTNSTKNNLFASESLIAIESLLSNANKLSGLWYIVPIPVFYGMSFQPMMVYLKRQENRDEKNRTKTKKQRFIIEFSFSGLGEIWIDGLFATNHKGVLDHFEIVVRSRRPIKSDLIYNLVKIFNRYKQSMKFSGTLGFELLDSSFKKPYEEDDMNKRRIEYSA